MYFWNNLFEQLTKNMKHVGCHDVVGELHVNSLTQK